VTARRLASEKLKSADAALATAAEARPFSNCSASRLADIAGLVDDAVGHCLAALADIEPSIITRIGFWLAVFSGLGGIYAIMPGELSLLDILLTVAGGLGMLVALFEHFAQTLFQQRILARYEQVRALETELEQESLRRQAPRKP
jgi:hypothetical protein